MNFKIILNLFFFIPSSHSSSDDNLKSGVYPLNLFKKDYDVRAGIYSLSEFITLNIQESFSIKNILSQDTVVFINGRLAPSKANWEKLKEALLNIEHGQVVKNDVLQLLIISKKKLKDTTLNFNNLPYTDLINIIQDLNIPKINLDFEALDYGYQLVKNLNINLNNHIEFRLKQTNHIGQQKYQKIKAGFFVKDMKVTNLDKIDINTSNGPVLLDNVTINPFSVLEGPLWIGEGSVVKPSSHITNSSIGKACKVAGEISSSLINDYSNKAHHGYLGDSIVGSWVNIGAGTTTSNLKINYKTIRVLGNQLDSEMMFLGTLMGDFCKTSINTTIYPGKILGLGSLAIDEVKSDLGNFQRLDRLQDNGSVNQYKVIDFSLFIDSINTMYQRRGQSLTVELKKRLEEIYRKV